MTSTYTYNINLYIWHIPIPKTSTCTCDIYLYLWHLPIPMTSTYTFDFHLYLWHLPIPMTSTYTYDIYIYDIYLYLWPMTSTYSYGIYLYLCHLPIRLNYDTYISRWCHDHHPFSLEAISSGQPPHRPLLRHHVLLPLDHVLRRQRLRHLHLPQGQEPQDPGNLIWYKLAVVLRHC